MCVKFYFVWCRFAVVIVQCLKEVTTFCGHNVETITLERSDVSLIMMEL